MDTIQENVTEKKKLQKVISSTNGIVLKRTTIYLLLVLYLVASSMISLLILFDQSRPSHYGLLWILPLIFGLWVFLCGMAFPMVWHNFCYIMIVGIFTIRNVFTPLVMRLGSYIGFFTKLNSENVNSGIMLMLYESIIIIGYATYKVSKSRRNENQILILKDKHIEKIIFGIVSVTLVGVFIIRPDYYSGITNIFSAEEIRLVETDGAVRGPLFTLFEVFLPIAYLYIAVFLMKKLNKRAIYGRKKTIFNVLIACIPFLFMNGADGFTLICVLALMLTSLKTGGVNNKIFYILVVAVVVGITMYLLLMTVGMSFGAQDLGMWEQLSKIFQAYFPGVCNFAGLFNINEHEKLQSLFYDLYYTIPFRNTLIGIPGDGRLAILYTADNKASAQILPSVGQLFHYFGLLSPFIECIYIKYAVDNFKKMSYETSIERYFARFFLVIYLVATPIMYNSTNFLARFFSTIIFLFAISSDGKIRVKIWE